MTLHEIRKVFRELADPEFAQHSQRFFKSGPGEYGEGDKFLGIRVPALRKQVKQHYTNMPRTLLRQAIERFPALDRKRYLHATVD